MANTLISNASVRSFRSTSYNLGGALQGATKIDASLGDVQYGTISANSNVTLSFGNWAPSGTKQTIELNFTVNDSNSYITFPSAVGYLNDSGGATLENSSDVNNLLTINAPFGVSQLNYQISTLDCGNTFTISPINRPRESTQIQTRAVSPVGFPGDSPGTISVGPSYNELPIISTISANNLFTISGNTSQLTPDLPIVFTGVSMEANINIGTTYYITQVASNTTFSVSNTVGGSPIQLAGNSSPTNTMYADPVTSLYVCTNYYNATTYGKTVLSTDSGGNITLNNTTSLVPNAPIIFTGNVVGGIVSDDVYFIKSVGSGGNITISTSRSFGVAGSTFIPATATATNSCYCTVYVGSDIWKMLPLQSW
jgi:hypothetical protein